MSCKLFGDSWSNVFFVRMASAVRIFLFSGGKNMKPICKDCNQEAKWVNDKWICPKCGKKVRRLPKTHISYPQNGNDGYSFE